MIRLNPSNSRDKTVAVYDQTADVYEIFADADCDSYIGCADTVAECRRIAQDWLNED